MRLLTAAESRELDRLSQTRYGVASYSLMTGAGEAVALALARRWPEALGVGVLVIAGKGNNGGDGMVAARRLLRSGARARVVLLGAISDLKGDAARACADLLGDGGEVLSVTEEAELKRALDERPGAVVDAIFGTGLDAPVSGLARCAIDAIHALGAPVLAVDISSGVNADTGAVMGCAVNASLTVTFGAAKFGHVSYPGATHCGELEVADIGFAPGALVELAARGAFLQRAEIQPLWHRRPDNSHKGMYGHALIVAASRGKSGAALLAARAALRTGAGLLTTAIPQSVAAIVAAGAAELMTEPMPERDGHFAGAATAERLRALIVGKSVLVVGPGIGVSDDTRELVDFLLAEGGTPHRALLIDADGLNVLAQLGCETVRKAKGAVVLTPHPGEMARLLATSAAEVNADRISAARRLAERSGASVVLKGARSVIVVPDATVYVNSTGNPGMAAPGMGDALSGMLGALLGQGMEPLSALALGVYIHGAAADRVSQRLGPVGYLAGDVIEELPAALAALASSEL